MDTANKGAIEELLKKFENDIIMLDALYQWASNSTGITAVRRKCPPSHKLIEENIKRRYNLDSDKGQYIYNKLIPEIENVGIDFATGYSKEYLKNINEKYGAVLREKTIERLNKASQEAKYIIWLYCKVKDRGGLFPYTDDYNDWRIGSMYKFAAIFNATFNSAITPTRKTIAIDVLIEIGFINKLNWITADCNKDRDEYIFPEYLEPLASEIDKYTPLPDLPDYERYIDALYDKKLIDALICLDELLHKGYVSEIDELHGKLIPQPYIIGKSGNAVAINPRIYESFKEIFFERKAKELKKENEIEVALNQLAEEKYYPELSVSEEEFELFNASRIWLVDTPDKSLAEYETLIVLTPWLTGEELKWLRDNYSQKFVVIISTFMGLPEIQKLYKELHGPINESNLNWMIVDVSKEKEVYEMIVNAKPKLFDELIEIVKEIEPVKLKPVKLPVQPPPGPVTGGKKEPGEEIKDIIIGSERESEQWGVIGKSGNNNVLMDLNAPHIIFVCGKMGYGKGYIIGVLCEMLGSHTIEHISKVLKKATIIVFHKPRDDVRSEFWSMVYPNDVESEIKSLKEYYDASPSKLFDEKDFRVFLAPNVYENVKEKFEREYETKNVFPLSLEPSMLSAEDWGIALSSGISSTDYIKELFKILDKLQFREFTVDELKKHIMDSELNKTQKKLAIMRIELVEDFLKYGDFMENLTIGGINVIDLRKLMKTPDDIFAIMTLMLSVIQSKKGFEDEPFVFVINEAHDYFRKGISKEFVDKIEHLIRRKRHGANWLLLDTHKPDDVSSNVVVFSDVKIIHRMDTLALKHLRDINTLTKKAEKSPDKLEIGEAIIVADESSEGKAVPILVRIRPRITEHGGATKTAV